MGSTKRHEKELAIKIERELKSATDPVEKIRLTALARGPSGIKDIGRMFRNMDDDRSGQISFQEFKKGVGDIGCVLSKDEAQEAFNAIDADNSGSVEYGEFLLLLRGKTLNKSRERLVQRAFEKLDRDKSGTITVKDLRGVYDVSRHPKVQSGEWSEDRALQTFLGNFDTPDNKDGTVTKEEFYSYYAGISASIDSDAYFSLMMENAWKLSKKPPARNVRGGAQTPNGTNYKPRDFMDRFSASNNALTNYVE